MNLPHRTRQQEQENYRGTIVIDNPFIDDRGYAPLELDLVDLAYHHTEGNRDMAYLIGQEIYRYLKNIEPEIDNWYEGKV